MKKHHYNILGVMSGTSLDGVDLAYIEFEFDVEKQWDFNIVVAETISYSGLWKKKLAEAITLNRTEIDKLDEQYTVHLASIIQEFIAKNNIKHIDAVCSHGHTIFHRPDLGYTLQIGNLPILADLIAQKVVCDFRVQDVLLGGQGAPLVPIGDKLLFSDYQACLNLGGFANVSYDNRLKYRIAYDICPVNVVLNDEVAVLGMSYDKDGLLAEKGTVNNQLLEELNAIDYYSLDAPKSLGIEFVNTFIKPIFAKYNLSVEDKLATMIDHIAFQINKGIPLKEGSKVLVTGGGAHNNYLLHRIRHFAPHLEFYKPVPHLIDFKEALIFGFLGLLRLRDEVNVLASVTGAKYDHSSGKIYDYFNKNY